MNTIRLPKNTSISVRVTKKEKEELDSFADKEQTTISNYARNILINNKKNYMKIENINPVLYSLEVAIKSFQYIDKKLIPANTPIDELSDEDLELILRKGEIRSEIRKLEAIKKRIES